MITLRQLEIFLCVARRQHVTAAGRELHLSQSAVSSALAALAERLSGPLFERSGRQLRLNERGRRLLDDAADLLQRAGDLEARYRSDEVAAGRLHIGASSTIGTWLLPPLVGAFVAAHPQVEIDLQVANSAEIEARLLDHRLDLAYIEGPAQQAAVVATPWRDDELHCFAAADHELARRRVVQPAALTRLRWIMREPGSGTRSVFEAALRVHGLQVAPYLTFGQSEAVKQAVRAGLGVGCLSREAIRREVDAGEFCVLRVPGLDLRRTLWQLQRRHGHASGALRACIEHLAPR